MTDHGKPTTMRFSGEMAEELALVARIEGISVSELTRRAIAAEIHRLRADPEFQQRLRDRIAADQRLLARMDEGIDR